MQRVAHEQLARICFIDYDREIALIGISKDPASGVPTAIGIGRLMKIPNTSAGRFHLLVSDQFQNKGLGKELLRDLRRFASEEGMKKIYGQAMVDDERSLHILQSEGFKVASQQDNIINMELVI
ncbi:MAG: GNAT family N-acetyltransferase [SAR324 cluster bacterium]|uniref:GNAT family N-acetyltransferase n=1 Tax=SAR324 cluster bacterium TaxID=2024889 RepID=A0A7X9FQS2_9DELT|nr:GNAT family N-acetyltransferase [SAR324 cluster bacterium]